MALVKKSTWRSMRHKLDGAMRDMNDGFVNVFDDMASPINDGINESMREDIPVDETEEERLDREWEEQQEREDEEWELQQEEEQRRFEEEQAWQAEQDRIIAEENAQPGMLSKMYDAFRDSSFYAGYTGVRNMAVGGALVGAGLGLTGTTGLAMAAAVPVAQTSMDIVKWAREKFQRDVEEQEKATEKKLMDAEAEASNGVPDGQRSGKPDVGTPEYGNIAAKERTNDQKAAIIEAENDVIEAAEQSGAGTVDPEYVQQTADELLSGIQFNEEPAFDFTRG